jgi:hypothetical protein
MFGSLPGTNEGPEVRKIDGTEVLTVGKAGETDPKILLH